MMVTPGYSDEKTRIPSRRMLLPFLILVAVFLPATPGLSQNTKPGKNLVYAPDILGVERLFMIVLNVPTDSPEIKVTVSPSDCATLIDRTPLPVKTDERRYYFRTLKPAKDAKVTLAHPDGDIVVPLTIWSFDDLRAFRKLKGTQLPRRWPLGEALPELKEGQTITTPADLEALKKRGAGRGKQWVKYTDDQIWAMQPDSTIPRWHWVNVSYGCPVHGTDIYRSRAYYPWTKDAALPYKWKIECPVGHELYPSNDFANGDMTSGEFPDDGFGGGSPYNGKRYGFIAETCQAYCHQMLQVAPDCAEAYVATGDVRYLHKSLVGFSRVAVEWSYLATMTQHRHRNSRSQVERLGPAPFSEGPCLARSGFTVYPIDLPGYQWRYAEAYDLIFSHIDKDPDIIPYLQGKGFDVKTHEDVRRFLEENLFAVWMQGAMDLATQSNEPYHQRGLARMAEMLNYKRGNEFLDWLYDGEGEMRIFVPNTYFRDGAPFESTGGYNGMHVVALGPIVESVEHLRKLRPEVYPEGRYPSLTNSRRYHNIFDFCMDTVLIDRTYPVIGDSGSFPAYSKLSKLTWHSASAEAFEHAYKLFRDPKFAWALANSSWQPSKDFPFTREETEAEAAKWPDDWNDASSLHDGYGIGILRGGKGDAKRALWVHHGHARGHLQDDLMDIGLAGYQGVLLSHMGYPRNWGYWENSWASHHVARQFPYIGQTGRTQFLVDAGAAHVAEVYATATPSIGGDGTRAEGNPDYWQRRTLALIDVSPDQFYCVDFYRISGGKDHWWAFHGQEGDVSTSGIDLTRQETGTLAGPDVPYGDAKWLKANGCSRHSTYGWQGMNFVFPHLYNVQRGLARQPWWIDWKLKTEEDLHMRLTVVQATGGEGSEPVEVNITDGTSPAGGKPYEMKWVMMHNQGEGATRTQVLSLIEPYSKEPVIRKVTPLKLSGGDKSGLGAAACRIELADCVDTIICASDPEVEYTGEGGLRFKGRFGFSRVRDGEPVASSLVDGTLLEGDHGKCFMDPREFREEIVAVDREKGAVTIRSRNSRSETDGEIVFITSPGRRVGHKVLRAEKVKDGTRLDLSADPKIGVGQVTGTKDFVVQSRTPFQLQGHGYYDGARIVNADGTAEYRILEARSGHGVIIDRKRHPDATAEKLAEEFPAKSWFRIYDYGVGDEVVWPGVFGVTDLRVDEDEEEEGDGEPRIDKSVPRETPR